MGLVLLSLVAMAGCGPPIGSVGAVFGVRGDEPRVFVRDAPAGLGAAEAGLRPGDELLFVDGEDVRDLGAEGVRERLRGVVGTTVVLTVARGDEIVRVRVTRKPFRRAGSPR